jgi:hypothetical protein
MQLLLGKRTYLDHFKDALQSMARSPRSAARGIVPAADPAASVKNYRHKQEATARPDVGAAPRFRVKK